jgi:ethanolamine utilization protein EutP (predicted NTPase)
LAAPPAHAWVIAVRSQLHTAPLARGKSQALIEVRPSAVVAGCLLQKVWSGTHALVMRLANIDCQLAWQALAASRSVSCMVALTTWRPEIGVVSKAINARLERGLGVHTWFGQVPVQVL